MLNAGLDDVPLELFAALGIDLDENGMGFASSPHVIPPSTTAPVFRGNPHINNQYPGEPDKLTDAHQLPAQHDSQNTGPCAKDTAPAEKSLHILEGDYHTWAPTEEDLQNEWFHMPPDSDEEFDPHQVPLPVVPLTGNPKVRLTCRHCNLAEPLL